MNFDGTRYYIITGYNEGEAIRPYLASTWELGDILNVSGDAVRYHEFASYSPQTAEIKLAEAVQEWEGETMEQRIEKWKKVVEALYRVGTDLNKEGRPDWELIDDHYRSVIESIMKGYERTFRPRKEERK